ncbi:MAG: FAD-dependent oxidoreductase, partial [Actinomycetota bacterium]
MSTITASTFGRRFRGDVVLPADAGYDAARAVYNRRIDARPAVIARCRGAADVVTALAVAREHGLELAVRGGGRHVAGYGTVNGGLVIDLGPIDDVRVDPAAATVRFGPGARNRDLLVEAEPYGLAPVTGVVGHVGASGLTLGGGIGWLGPRHGFSSDNVVSLDVVTVDGERLRVSADEHPELFWGMR